MRDSQEKPFARVTNKYLDSSQDYGGTHAATVRESGIKSQSGVRHGTRVSNVNYHTRDLNTYPFLSYSKRR